MLRTKSGLPKAQQIKEPDSTMPKSSYELLYIGTPVIHSTTSGYSVWVGLHS